MKNLAKTSKWLRWTAAGAFGLMLMLNVMVGIAFEKNQMLPTLSLFELGSSANAACDLKAYGIVTNCQQVWCSSSLSYSGCGWGNGATCYNYDFC